MIEIKNKSECNGCHACQSVCPKKCITMSCDELGFRYPEVNKDVCIECGLCVKKCPMLSDKENEKFTGKVFAAYNKNDTVRKSSSSGGVFTLLATDIIRRGGVVFGASFDSDFSLSHICVGKEEDLHLLRGSKYLQSKIGTSFHEAKEYLEKNIPVMFTGTPCQIAGLKKYLGKKYENLLTQDVVCHGVPSPYVWKKYLESLEKEYGAKAIKVNFRNKVSGWSNYSVTVDFDNGERYSSPFGKDPYMDAFLSNLSLRDSCYNCKFKHGNIYSDITLGDFWGIQTVLPRFDMQDKGSSIIIVNTVKGYENYKNIENELNAEELFDISPAIKANPCIEAPVAKPKAREWFFKSIKKKSLRKTMKRYYIKKRAFDFLQSFFK